MERLDYEIESLKNILLDIYGEKELRKVEMVLGDFGHCGYDQKYSSDRITNFLLCVLLTRKSNNADYDSRIFIYKDRNKKYYSQMFELGTNSAISMVKTFNTLRELLVDLSKDLPIDLPADQ